MLYTDPSGHFGQIIAGAAIGAAIGGEGNYGYQVYQNRQNGMDWGQSLTCIKWGSVGGWALAGAGIGALVGIAPVAWPMLQGAFFNASISAAGLLTMHPWIGVGLTGLGVAGEGYALYQALFNHNQDAAAMLGIGYSLTGQSALMQGLSKGWTSITSTVNSYWDDFQRLGQWGVPDEFYPPRKLSPWEAAIGLLKNGGIWVEDLKALIPQGSPNEFRPGYGIESGYKYNSTYDDIPVEIKWHSPQPSAKRYSLSFAGRLWTAQIKVNEELLGYKYQGPPSFYEKPDWYTHIPILGNPRP